MAAGGQVAQVAGQVAGRGAVALGQGALAVGQGAADVGGGVMAMLGDGAFRIGQQARRLVDQINDDLYDDYWQSVEDDSDRPAPPPRQPQGFGLQRQAPLALGAARPAPVDVGGPMPRGAPLALGPASAAAADLSLSVWAQGGRAAQQELARIANDPEALDNAAAMIRAYAVQLREEIDDTPGRDNQRALDALEDLGEWSGAIRRLRAAVPRPEAVRRRLTRKGPR